MSNQIFPVIGATQVTIAAPIPVPTQDVSDGTPGQPVPTTALQIAGSDGTDLQAVSTDTSGNVNVNVVNTPTIKVEGTVTVEVVGTSTVVVAGSVTIAETPTVAISGTATVEVAGIVGTPTVEVAGILGTSTVTVAGSVTIAETPTVAILGTSTVSVAGIVQVAPTGSANTRINPFFTEITDGASTMGAMANFGSNPGAVPALNANVAVQQGTVQIAGTSTVEVAGIVGTPTVEVAGILGTSTVQVAGISAGTVQIAGTSTVEVAGIVGTSTVVVTGTIPIDGDGASSTAAAAWTSATTLNTAVTLVSATFKYASLVVTLNQAPTGTLTGGGVIFEVSNDNSNWQTLQGLNTVSGVVTNAVTFAPATYSSFLFSIAGWQYFRVRLNPAITGSGTVTVGYAAQSLPATVTGIAGTPTVEVAGILGTSTVQVAGIVGTSTVEVAGIVGTPTVEVAGILGTSTVEVAGIVGTPTVEVAGILGGTIAVAGTSTVEVAGIVGTSTVALAGVVGPVAPGTAAASSIIVGSVVATSAAAGTVNQQIALQADVSGCIRINPAGQTGSFHTIAGTQPAAGTNYTLTVPSGHKYIVKAIFFELVIANSGAARSITVNGTALQVVVGAGATINATTTYQLGPGLPYQTGFTSGFIMCPIPEFVLGPADNLTITLGSIAATDQIKDITINVIDYLD
jgi:hypothetical protein